MEVLDSIKPLLCFSRVLGIAPFAFRHRTLQKSHGVKMFSQLLIVVDAVFISLFTVITVGHHSRNFWKALSSASHWVPFSANSLLSVFVLLRHDDVVRLNILKLNDFRVLGSRLNLKSLVSLRRSAMTYCSIVVLHTILFLVFYVPWAFRSHSVYPLPVLSASFAALYLTLNLSYALCFQFVVYATLIRCCVAAINRKFFQVANWGRKRTSVRKELSALAKAHDAVNDVSDDFASIFSFYFLCVSILFFVETVFTLTHYFTDTSGWFDYVGNCVWLSYFVSQFVFVVVSSVFTSRQAEKTANYLHELFIDNDDPELKEEIEIFSLQLLHRKVEFNACGFFKLDFSLLYSMVGAVTTYIIILMQFQGNQEPGYGNCAANCTACSPVH